LKAQQQRYGAKIVVENYVGNSIPRVDAKEKVTGKALFPGDLSMVGMVHAKVLFSDIAHAKIINIDISSANKVPGVMAVLTADDVPVNEYGISEFDQPVLAFDKVRYIGDRVALVVAETEKAAEKARDLIRVDYEDLPVLDDMQRALDPDAPIIHPVKGSNLLSNMQIRKGDTEAGFAEADLIVEENYYMGWQEHAYLQPDAGLAYLDDDGTLIVQTAGQWAHDDRRQLSHALNMPEENIRVVYTYIGGAFGGREDVSVQILLGLAAMKVKRPVRLAWNREETTIGHHKGHPMWIYHKWGAKKNGRITAQQTEILADAGGYASTSTYVVASTALLSTGPYNVPNLSLDAKAVYTNNIVCGALRGFGAQQAVFAAEMQMNHLADTLGMDPVELRMLNMLKEGDLTGTMTPTPPKVTASETLSKAAEAAGWRKSENIWRISQPKDRQVRPGVVRGVGIASGWKNVGYTLGYPEKSEAVVELYGGGEVDRAVVRIGISEVGQGILTAVLQMAADALILPPERIQVINADTSEAPSAGSVSASRMAFMSGNAIIGAAREAYQAWKNEERPAIASYTYFAPETRALDPDTGRGKGAFAFAYLAQAVEVDVDLITGLVSINKIISAHDLGKVVNPLIVEGQIEGGAIQAMGWATIENFQMKGGKTSTTNFNTYLIPTTCDTPVDFKIIILEEPLPIGPWGVNGVGEMPFLAVAPAILDAVHDATGVWFSEIPLTPEKVLDGLDRHRPKAG
jgi:CO/xanthine dehydrogenase Mo-binding subunit